MEEAYLLTEDEIHDAILEIISGEKIVELEPIGEVVLFSQPTSDVRLYSAFLEKKQFEKYKSENFLTEEEIERDNLIDEFFSVKDQEELEEIEDKLKAYRSLAKKRIVGSDQYKNDLIKIRSLEGQKQRVLDKKSIVKTFTAEYKAREDRYLYTMVKCVLTLDKKQKWENLDSFMDSIEELDHLYYILNEYLYFYFGKSTREVRQIARADFWRNYYIGSSKGLLDSLFNRRTKDLSLDQLNLLSWSSFYSDIYEMSYSDRPSEEIIEDDERLDAYLREYIRKTQAEAAANSTNSAPRSKINAKDSDHVVITAESDDYVKFHKSGLFSDTEIIKNRAKDSTKYSEKEELLKIKRKRALKNLKKGK